MLQPLIDWFDAINQKTETFYDEGSEWFALYPATKDRCETRLVSSAERQKAQDKEYR